MQVRLSANRFELYPTPPMDETNDTNNTCAGEIWANIDDHLLNGRDCIVGILRGSAVYHSQLELPP
jgi:hypothetical protein